MRSGGWGGGRGGTHHLPSIWPGLRSWDVNLHSGIMFLKLKICGACSRGVSGTLVLAVGRRMESVLSLPFKEMKPSAPEASRSEGRLQRDIGIWCAFWAGPAIFCCALLVPNNERDLSCERRRRRSISACHCGGFLYVVPSCVPEVECFTYWVGWYWTKF